MKMRQCRKCNSIFEGYCKHGRLCDDCKSLNKLNAAKRRLEKKNDTKSKSM